MRTVDHSSRLRGRAGITVALVILAGGIAGPYATADGGVRRWEWLGPGNAGGIVRAIVIDPNSDPLRILVASPGGGIWRSTNGGASWTLTDGFLPSLVVSCMDMAPSDPNIIYAGTGESFANRSPAPSGGRGEPGAGVLKSTDGGATWTRLPSTANWANDDNRFVNWIAVHPTNPNLVLAATDAALHRTTDGGQTWENPPPRLGRVTEVRWVTSFGFAVAGLEPTGSPSVVTNLECALFSQDFGQTWTASKFVGEPGATTLTAAAGAGTSTIQVASWADFFTNDFVRIGTGTNSEVGQVRTRTGTGTAGDPFVITLRSNLAQAHASGERVVLLISQRTALAVTPGGARVYAAMGAGAGTIWRSDDAGQTFDFVSNPNEEDGDPEFDYLRTGTNPRAFYSNVIWARPRPPPNNTIDLVVVGGVETLRSLDGGLSFERISRGVRFDEGTSAHIDYHAIVPHPRFPLIPSVYFGNDGGIQRADDIFKVQQESGWTNLAHDLGLTQLHGGKTTPDGQWLFGCGQDIDAVIRGPAGGINDWDLWNGVGDSRGVAVEADPPFPLFAPTFYNLRNNQFWRLTNGGADSVQSMTGMTNPCGSGSDAIVRAVAIDPNNPAMLVAGGRAIWRTTNRATNWSQIRGAVDCSQITTVVEIARGNSSLIWAGYDDGRLSRTNGSVSTWIDVNGPGSLPACGGGTIPVDCAVSDILIDPQNPQRVLVTFTGLTYDFRLDCPQNVFITTNSGACWTPLMGTPPFALPPSAVFSIAMHPEDSNWLYVGTDNGVYASEDGGLTWNVTPLFADHEGPYNVMVRELAWHDPSFLVASTYGLGMHRARVLTTVYADAAYSGIEEGTQAQPYDTVREAIIAAGNGTNISLQAGTYAESGVIEFRTRGDVRATGGAATVR